MNLSQENINAFLNKYVSFVDEISNINEYDNNIKHLLYVIVPAFVVKYGINNESTILECFKNIKVYVRKHPENIQAAFNRRLKKKDDKYYTEKYITVDPFSNTSLSVILDNFIHEFNHAVNSYNNEIILTDDLIMIRTGLSTLNYDREDMSFIEKSEEIVLEELLNTAQTEDIINIIKSFNKYSIDNHEVSNTLYGIKQEIGVKNYESEAYYYQKKICEVLINNKTFTPTINNLRFKGLIEDIPELFDNVIGQKNSYKKLNDLLTEMHAMIIKYSESKIFKNKYLSKIKELSNSVTRLINDYEKKCIFK